MRRKTHNQQWHASLRTCLYKKPSFNTFAKMSRISHLNIFNEALNVPALISGVYFVSSVSQSYTESEPVQDMNE